LKIRTATTDDLEMIAAVEAECFPPAEAATKEEFAKRLQYYRDHFWLMFDGEKLIAFVDGFVTDEADLTDEMIIMVPVAFVLEFFIVGKIAQKLAFTVMKPTDRPQFITYAISICICCIMCPIMSLVATILFKDQHTFGTWIQTWTMNFPMAICWQMFYCGPLVRLIFRAIFRRK
jgi:hypothetical protein